MLASYLVRGSSPEFVQTDFRAAGTIAIFAAARKKARGALSAECRARRDHGTSRCQSPPDSACLALSSSSGATPACAATARSKASFAGDIVEHAGEEVRRAGRRSDVAGTDAGEREETLEVLGIAGEIAERRDRQRRGRLLARLRVGFAGPASAFPDHRGSVPEVVGGAGGVSTRISRASLRTSGGEAWMSRIRLCTAAPPTGRTSRPRPRISARKSGSRMVASNPRAQRLDALRRNSRRRRERTRHRLPRHDQLERGIAAGVARQFHDRGNVGEVLVALQGDLQRHRDPLAGQHVAVAREKARPRPAATAVDLAAFHREHELGAAGIAGDDAHRQGKQVAQHGREHVAVGAGSRCADQRLLGDACPARSQCRARR